MSLTYLGKRVSKKLTWMVIVLKWCLLLWQKIPCENVFIWQEPRNKHYQKEFRKLAKSFPISDGKRRFHGQRSYFCHFKFCCNIRNPFLSHHTPLALPKIFTTELAHLMGGGQVGRKKHFAYCTVCRSELWIGKNFFAYCVLLDC